MLANVYTHPTAWETAVVEVVRLWFQGIGL